MVTIMWWQENFWVNENQPCFWGKDIDGILPAMITSALMIELRRRMNPVCPCDVMVTIMWWQENFWLNKNQPYFWGKDIDGILSAMNTSALMIELQRRMNPVRPCDGNNNVVARKFLGE